MFDVTSEISFFLHCLQRRTLHEQFHQLGSNLLGVRLPRRAGWMRDGRLRFCREDVDQWKHYLFIFLNAYTCATYVSVCLWCCWVCPLQSFRKCLHPLLQDVGPDNPEGHIKLGRSQRSLAQERPKEQWINLKVVHPHSCCKLEATWALPDYEIIHLGVT